MNLRPILHSAAGLPVCCGLLLAAPLAVPAAEADTSTAEANTEYSADAGAVTLEYQLKADFLFNFANFIQWPATNGAPTNLFRIAILDNGTVFPIMSQVLATKTVNGRAVRIERLTRLSNAKNFEMLFVAQSQEERIPALLKVISNAPVLTVGESADFVSSGGCINLICRENSIRFEINLKAAESAGLKVSSKLATLAKAVKPPKEDK